MGSSPYVPVGKVLKAVGTDGTLAVASQLDLADFLVPGTEVWFVPPSEHPRPDNVVDVREGPRGPQLNVATIESTEGARLVVGKTILVHEDVVPAQLERDEADPIGLRVTADDGRDLGVVTQVIVTGANDVWVLDGSLGEVLIPVIPDVVLTVDAAAATATVRLMPGLLPGEDA